MLTNKFTRNKPIQLSIIQVITSFTLKCALNSPGSIPHIAPPIIANISDTYHGVPSTIAANSAQKAPIVYCPGAPILNNPVLNANATERPASINGVA